MPSGEFVARAAFQILFKFLGRRRSLKCGVELYFPGLKLYRVWAFTGVVLNQTAFEIVRVMTFPALAGLHGH